LTYYSTTNIDTLLTKIDTTLQIWRKISVKNALKWNSITVFSTQNPKSLEKRFMSNFYSLQLYKNSPSDLKLAWSSEHFVIHFRTFRWLFFAKMNIIAVPFFAKILRKKYFCPNFTPGFPCTVQCTHCTVNIQYCYIADEIN
jgi:hypothetical protein